MAERKAKKSLMVVIEALEENLGTMHHILGMSILDSASDDTFERIAEDIERWNSKVYHLVEGVVSILIKEHPELIKVIDVTPPKGGSSGETIH